MTEPLYPALHLVFDQFIDTYIKTQIGTTDNFLSESLATHLRYNITNTYRSQMKPAITGNSYLPDLHDPFRKDVICWLDRANNNIFENEFLDIIDAFIIHLNATCYTGINSYEFHYTLYNKGSFYKTHIDQFKNDDSRKYSMVFYLNKGWKVQDGGELCIHHKDHLQHISPESGKGVFFKSNEISHEVLVTNSPRMSITGWLKVI